jgi:predicted outer membrane protein
MRHFMMTVIALAAFAATVATAQAGNQTPSSPTVSHPATKRTVSQTARPSLSAPGDGDHLFRLKTTSDSN